MLSIREARPGDEEIITRFVRELAVYEKLEHEAVATPDQFAKALFGPTPTVFCDIADWDGAPAGFALWFYSFSTFLGKHGLYLEDLFVRSALRGKGIGKALLKHLAARCEAEGLARFEWRVLDWNQPSIDFYEDQGAEIMREWLPCRVSGEPLRVLGAPAEKT